MEEGPGVLDVKWKIDNDNDNDSTRIIRGLWSLSDGTISLGSWKDGKLSIDQKFTIQTNHIIMSSDFITSKEGGGTFITAAAAASSSGAIFIVNVNEPGEKVMLAGHGLEAWTVTFDPQIKHLLHSGGDDALWKGWDLRACNLAFTCPWHTAGVCSISVHPTDEHLIATGSYDKFTSLWDRRNLKQPMKSLKVSSGVWKLKWHPSGDKRILAACMYDGFYVFDFDTNDGPISKFDPGALSYGCDWLDGETALTCSFYNNQLQIWTI